MAQVEGEAKVLREGLFQIQVCVPSIWDDEKVMNYAEMERPCGTSKGWTVDKDNPDNPERVQCSMFPSHVHIILNA